MKNILLLLFMLSTFVLSALDVQVPILWQRSKMPKTFALKSAGFMHNKDMAVWALEFPNLQEKLKLPRFLISLYMNTDNNMKTGRTPGKDGNDFQLNIQVGPKTLSAIDWRKSRYQRIPLYDDDYLVASEGDMLYIFLRGEPLQDTVKFTNSMKLRLLVNSNNQKVPAMDDVIKCDNTNKKFFAPYNFIRFGAERTALIKTSEAVLIPRNDDLKVWNTYGERYQEKEAMPKVVAKENALKFSAARGEREAVHFAVTGKKPFKSFKIVPEDLKSASGKVIKSSQLVVRYVAFAATVREEYFTDILSPVYLPQKSNNHFAMIGITVPRDAVAGVYKGKAQLYVDGVKKAPLPIELEIYPFALPEVRSFKTAYNLKPSYIKSHFAGISPKDLNKEFQEEARIAREFRFSPRLPHCLPKLKWTKDEKLIIDWTQFDKVIKQYFNEYKFTVFQDAMFQIGSHGGPLYARITKLLGKNIKTSDPVFEKFFYQLVKQTYLHYKKLGILDKCMFTIWDEPYQSVYDDIKRCCAIAKKAAPEIEWCIAVDHAVAPLEKEIKIWCTNFLTLYNLRNKATTKNARVWVYNKVGMESLREPASVPRLYYWLAKKYNVECYEYSEINGFRVPHEGKRKDIFYNNWVNYIWFYPDKKPGSPRASLRMLLSADGMDDYDYLVLYQKYCNNKAFPKIVEKAFPDLLPGGHINFKVKTNREMQLVRAAIAKEISKAMLKK